MEVSNKISNIIQCFADLNLETNENFPYDINLPSVSFEQNIYQGFEGQSINIIVSLSEPSQFGRESIIIANIDQNIQGNASEKKIYEEIKWQANEQHKTLSIQIPSDLIIERQQESIDLGITGLSGVVGGQFLQSKILISDTTAFRYLSIYAPEGVGILPARNPNETSIQTMEGTNQEFTLSLNGESFGVEEIDVVAYKQSNETKKSLGIIDSSDFLIRKTIKWTSGEISKKISTLEILGESLNSDHNGLIITLSNPKMVNINQDTISVININIQQTTTKRRYTTINLGNVLIQKGGIINSQNTEARRIINGSTVDSVTNNWLIEIGTFYQDETNSSEISEETNYVDYPNYFFGTRLQEDNFPLYFIIENIGEVSSEINGEIIQPNESKSFRIYRDNLQFILPSNSTLIKRGKSFNGKYLSEDSDLYAETKYRFYIKLNPPKIKNSNGNDTNPHGFVLKGATEFDGDTYKLGDFEFENFKDEMIASANIQTLFSYYRSIKTLFNGSCTQDFSGADKIKNIKVQGIIMMHDDANNESDIFGHIFENQQINPICQSISKVSDGNSWSSLEYEIYENPDF